MEPNFFSAEFHRDPYPAYRWLREHAPLYRDEDQGLFALARFQDVAAASMDWQTYSSDTGEGDDSVFSTNSMMIFTDPPRHDALRRLASRAFGPHAIADLEPAVRAAAVRLLDPLVRRGGGDFVQEFAAPLTMEILSRMLGIPEEERGPLRAWTNLVSDGSREHLREMRRYWLELLPALRRRPNGGLICALLDAEIQAQDGARSRLTDEEIVGFCHLLCSAGIRTAAALLSNAAVLCARHPAAYAKIRTDPRRIPAAVEEVLRYASPSQHQKRVATRDVDWYGVRVPRGASILLLTASANRDEREFPNPDLFDVERDARTALGFGVGIHACLGAALGRLQSRVALEEFACRFPDYGVDERHCARTRSSVLYSYHTVRFSAGSAT